MVPGSTLPQGEPSGFQAYQRPLETWGMVERLIIRAAYKFIVPATAQCVPDKVMGNLKDKYYGYDGLCDLLKRHKINVFQLEGI